MHRLPAALFLSAVLVACGGDDESTPLIVADDEATTAEDTAVEIEVLANDTGGAELHILRANIEGERGTVEVVDGQRLRFAPAANFHGEATFTYRANDGAASANGDVTVTVTPVNDAPAATAASIATGRNEAKAVRLAGTDVDGDTLAFEVAAQPMHGTLSGTTPDLTYTPATGYSGADTFTFRAKDASATSEPATITIAVADGGSPVAQAQDVDAVEETARTITLTGTDPDGDALTFAVVSQPEHGTLSGTAPNLTYTPVADFAGPDSFRFTVSDNALTSAPAFVHIDVANLNDAPVATAQAITMMEDEERIIVLGGTDADGDGLDIAIVDPPDHGEIIATQNGRRYQPASNYNGTDAFTFTVSDRHLTSAPATVTFEIAPRPDTPIAVAQPTVAVTEDVAQAITLVGLDADGDAVTLAIATQPAHGTLSGELPNLTYTPAANFAGNDSFTFTASDGTLTSPPRTIAIAIAPVDDVPVVASFTGTVMENGTAVIPLPVTDVDGETLTFEIWNHAGVCSQITGSGASRQLVMSCHYNGGVGFEIRASDGHSWSPLASFLFNVIAIDDAPEPHDDIAIVMPGQSITVDVLDNDIDWDGQIQLIDSVTAPAHGDVEIVDNELVFTPAPGNTAPVTMTYTVEDQTPHHRSATASLTIGIGEFPSGLAARFVAQLPIVGDAWNQVRQHDVSGDGRYTAFMTPMDVLPSDDNGVRDVYVLDRVTGAFELVSVGEGGVQGNANAERPSISDDGRYVAFASAASNLVAGDTNGTVDVFVRDRVSRTTIRASVGPGGVQVSGTSRDPDLSADGSVVAFVSTAFQLVADDANATTDVFVRDLAAGVTSRVSVRTGGGEADLESVQPAISGDGRIVAFTSGATNLVTGDTNGQPDVFVHDRTSGVTERASVSSTGGEGSGRSFGAQLSFNGRFLVFNSYADNLVPGNPVSATYIRDRQAVTTTVAESVYLSSYTISGDGRYLAGATGDGACFVKDRFAGTYELYSPYNGNDLFHPVISRNARYVGLISNQALVPNPSGSTRLYLFSNPL
ncbi:MAG TPA: Ig-like domain-containing protein [Kofleriaceae bacterium]|nr:Ig-like domain-containing protein [Kofleriaceae bacterium]